MKNPPEARRKKQSIYIPDEMLDEIKEEAKRQVRSHSWIIERAWERARKHIARFVSPPQI